jgi:hypothetical protein
MIWLALIGTWAAVSRCKQTGIRGHFAAVQVEGRIRAPPSHHRIARANTVSAEW